MKTTIIYSISFCLLLGFLSGCTIKTVDKKEMTPLEMYVAAEQQVDMERHAGRQSLSKMRRLELMLSPFFGALEKVCGATIQYDLNLADWLLLDQNTSIPENAQ